MKIKQISFENYRAFLGPSDPINVGGRNLLIYGENGSGKSSIYQGIKDFFKAFDVTWTIERSPKHLKAGTDDGYNVKVVFDDDAKTSLIFDGQPLENESSGQTFLLNSFLSYKELLRTHFLAENEVFEERFFKLLTGTLLKEQEIGDLTIGKRLEEIQRLQGSRKSEDQEKRESLLERFNALFPARLREISEQCQKILEFFYPELVIDFMPSPISVERYFDESKKVQRRIKGSIALSVTYIGVQSVDHTMILNEARLSALAIAIYLGAVSTNPISRSSKCKILCLDDVFIGLDTSNRLPLLKVLTEYSIDGGKPFFEDFQIFITTYDRYWFEIAKKHLDSAWHAMEIFVGEQVDSDDVRICDRPIIIQESLTNLEKAKRYFEAFDYFSAGNWLRKALEEELERLIPATFRIEVDNLEGLIDKLFVYFGICESSQLVPAGLARDLRTFKSSVLNPSSHHDLKSPLYRAEVLEVFGILEELQKLPVLERKLLAGMRSSLFYEDETGNYKAEYILRENVYSIVARGQPTRIVDANHSIVSWSLDGKEFAKKDGTEYIAAEIDELKSKLVKLSERPERISKFLDLADAPDWNEFKNREGKTLLELSTE